MSFGALLSENSDGRRARREAFLRLELDIFVATRQSVAASRRLASTFWRM